MEYEYNQIAKFYNAYSHTQRWLLEFVEDMLIENHIFEGTIVDLGCGSGVLFEYLEDSLASIGVDIANELLIEAGQNAPHGKYIHHDIVTYHHPEKVEVVTCLFDTMNHLRKIEDVKQVIKNMHEMLLPGGIAIFDMLGKEELEQLTEQSYVLPLDTEFGTAYFQAYSEDAENIQWQIDVYSKKQESIYEKEVICFSEKYYSLKEVHRQVSEKFTHVQMYTSLGEKLQELSDFRGRIFFVCHK
ncbi:MAG: class I SAM-dependent methyltransferase [Culicoidibacterales bacterium]